jgi:hypothetical protein
MSPVLQRWHVVVRMYFVYHLNRNHFVVLAYDRTVLWMHLSDAPSPALAIDVPTVHMDIVPTLLNTPGFDEDVLCTQGCSLLGHVEYRQCSVFVSTSPSPRVIARR